MTLTEEQFLEGYIQTSKHLHQFAIQGIRDTYEEAVKFFPELTKEQAEFIYRLYEKGLEVSADIRRHLIEREANDTLDRFL